MAKLISSIVGVLFVCSAIEAMKLSGENHLSVKRSAEDSETRMIETFQKLTNIAEEANFTYFSVFASNIAANVENFRDSSTSSESSSETIHRVLNSFNSMQRDILAQLREKAAEKSRMTTAQFDQWQGKWASTKAVTTIVLLTLFGTSEIAKLYFMFAETFVMLIIALVEDFQTADNALKTVESLVLVLADLVMN